MKKRYKDIFFFWKGQAGSAIISTLISVALLGISGAGLVQYVSNFQKTTGQTLERVNVDPLLRSIVINNMRSLLIEKDVEADGSKSEQNRYGICSFLHKPRLSHGVEKLKISFQERSSFAGSRWQVFFPQTEWEPVSSSHCKKIDKSFSEGDFSRCYKYAKKTDQADDVIYVMAQIIPREFPSLAKIDVSQTSNTYDPKQVIFQLRTAVYVYSFNEDKMSDHGQDPNDPGARGKSTSYISYQSAALWTDAVGECHIQARDGNWTVVNLSATGPGSNLEHKVINSLTYGGDDCNKITLFDVNENVVQVGNIDNALISSVIALNARVACTKNKFSCRQTIKTEALEPNTYDSFQFSFNMLNESYSYTPIEKFNVTLKKADGKEVDGTDNEILDGVNISFYNSNASLLAVQANKDINYSFSRGSSLITVSTELSDTTESEKLASYCHDICQSYSTGNSGTYVYPAVNIHEKPVAGQACVSSKDYSDSVDNRVQCIVCHTKACHRYGLGTFGPLDNELRTISVQNLPSTQRTVYGMSDEPLDGQVPECVVANSYETDKVRELPANVSGSGVNVVSGCKAMAMKVSNADSFKDLGTNTYEATDCSTSLPVLCFTNGHYLPALKVNTSNLNAPYELVVAPFEKAEEVCFNIGQEIGLYYDLGITLANTYKTEYSNTNFANRAISTIRNIPQFGGGSLPGSFNLSAPVVLKFDFVNNASRGLFLAPSSYSLSHFKLTKQIGDIVNLALGKSNKVWTAMEWDAEGLVVASPPWALVAKDDSLALFHDRDSNKSHRLVLLQDTRNYNTASKYFALTYNLRWKGLVPQPATSSFPFVCKNKTTDRFFITSSSGVLSEGPARCKANNGLFVPPESGLDWSKLMLELNSNDDYYPFPDPALDPSDVVSTSFLYKKSLPSPRAWVALQTITGNKAAEKTGIRASELKLYSDHFPVDSAFRADNKQDILDSLFDDSRFSGAVKARYLAHPMAAMTTSGLIPKDGSANALLKEMYNVMDEVLKINEIDIDNYGDKSTQLIPSGYNKICLDDSQRSEYIPVSIHDLSSDCPDGGVALDISNTLADSTKFKPTSYKYGSYWIKNIGVSDTEYVILTGGMIQDRVSGYNDKLDFLGGCDGGCTSEWNTCNGNCDSQHLPCPSCDSVADTCGTPPNTYVCHTSDCSAKQACEAAHAACQGVCDAEKDTCRGQCTTDAHADYNI